jgi:ATP-binding cassette subfamily B protein
VILTDSDRGRHRLRRALGLLGPFFRRYGLRLTAGCLALITVDFIQLWIPRVIKSAVDSLQEGFASSESLLHHGGLILLLSIAVAALRFFWRYFILGFSRYLERDIRDSMVSHVIALDRTFFQKRPAGEIMALSSNDLASVQLACGMGLVAFTDAVVMTVAALAFMAYIHPGLTAIAMAPMPVLAVLTRFLAARLHHRFRRVQELFSHLTEFARNCLASLRLIKAYTQERVQLERFDRLGRAYIRNNLKLAAIQGTLFPMSGFIGNMSLLLVLFFGGRLTIRETITAGDFVAFINYLFMLTWPMMALGWVANLFQRGVTSLERIRDLLEEKPALRDPPHPVTLPVVRGQLRIRNLTFTYPGTREPALNEVSLETGPGVLGIVGRTGSGKSTLCRLLARLYPIPDGTYYVDGIDVNRLSVDAVRRQIAYVPQNVILFSESIAQNIALGRPEASREEIEAVARAAAIHEEIMAMEEGYDTRVGERGVRLSGGQRQRIALARALLTRRPILIIDDGLSAVDMETEYAIVHSLRSYLEGRTCIIVSHRVAPLSDADEIVILEAGRVAARGTHRRLLETSGFYAAIARHQAARRPGDGA